MSDRGGLTELEGFVLAQIAHQRRTTTYEVMKTLAESPLAGLSASTGAIYPVVKRLRERGFVVSEAVPRGSGVRELLSATRTGLAAVRAWVANVKESDLLPHDPLRVKLLYFNLLTPKQQAAWIAGMRRALAAAEDRLGGTAGPADEPVARIVAAGARQSVRQRREMIERVSDELKFDGR